MSVEPIKTEVRRLLAMADEKLKRARLLHDQGSDAQKVEAAGQLVFLERQKQALEARMTELDQADEKGPATTVQWFKEDWMLLMQRLDAFIDGR
jgi:hypothetical protein